MLKLSRNNQNINPEHSAIGNIQSYGYFIIGYYYVTTCLSKQLPVGLMVLSDGMVHFLKIEKNLTNLPKLSCGFNEFRIDLFHFHKINCYFMFYQKYFRV